MTKSERQIIFEIKNFKIWASDDVPLKRYWRIRQDLCECAMAKRHVAVLLALRLLARERVQNRPSKQRWMCNGYRECGSFVGTTGPGQSVSEHRPSRLVWMCNGYPACCLIVDTTGTCPSVNAHRPSRLVWMCNGYSASRRMVGTTSTGPSVSAHRPSRLVWMYNGYRACGRIACTLGTGPCVILKDKFFNRNQTGKCRGGKSHLTKFKMEWGKQLYAITLVLQISENKK